MVGAVVGDLSGDLIDLKGISFASDTLVFDDFIEVAGFEDFDPGLVEVFNDLGCGFEIRECGGGFTVDAVDPDFLSFEDVGEDSGFIGSGVGQEFEPAAVCPEIVVETFEE